ncbi:hypothetical protein BGI33_02825 [Snodgrassella alvi]|uniref:Uncharacterized protein n=2 Tax=Snodgrassella alvi TaxID=1196083 RepID=A0A2N9WUS2_9NEIS|nr:STY0301 family protein [Snodgrassella alvi]PIT16585.1 hypothetical protein BGI32_03975 [Snodgrassella alvi]PIT17500.1 hypothetical protein BGI33_02825 [Snodgrassella alvi]PIT18066.1 hypothetical protein BGI34_06245 [Snodgrassella alvi]
MNNGMDSSCRIVRLNSEGGVMFLMLEINFMLSNNKKIATLFTSLLLSLLSINCHAQTPVVSCPATFSDRHTIYHLYHAKLFDGPVCKKVQLKPEFKNDKEIWVLDTRMDPSLVCIYDGTNHYIVLDANGATYCEKTNAPVQAKCM